MTASSAKSRSEFLTFPNDARKLDLPDTALVNVFAYVFDSFYTIAVLNVDMGIENSGENEIYGTIHLLSTTMGSGIP